MIAWCYKKHYIWRERNFIIRQDMSYTFTIRFDDDARLLSASNGLPVDTVGDLLVLLSKAVGLKKGENLTLSEVKGNCYALAFSTGSSSLHDRARSVHDKISRNDLLDFNRDQRKYAGRLYSIIRDNKYKIDVYTPDKSFTCRITTPFPGSMSEFYFEIDSVSGVIASIGSSSLDTPSSIKLSKENYAIRVTSAQERDLVKYFKGDKLCLTIEKRVSVATSKIESASLIDFEVMASGKTFPGEANKLMERYKERGLFPGVKDTVSALRELREGGDLN